MEDLYVKPGNQDRGWNDPPQFSYGLQTARGPQRNLLNKRVGPQSSSGPGTPPSAPPIFNPLAPPPRGAAPPPFNPAPPLGSSATPPPVQGPKGDQREASQSESRPDVEAVLSVLNGALSACRGTVRDQVCKDMDKRLRLLEDSWRTGRLSEPVQRRMDSLCHDLQMGSWDSADEIHRSLMVDHVTEVSQWMVGVKRLIAETRKLSPELLEPLQNLKRTVQDPVEPVQDPVEPVQGPAESVQDSPKPAQESVEAPQVPVLQS